MAGQTHSSRGTKLFLIRYLEKQDEPSNGEIAWGLRARAFRELAWGLSCSRTPTLLLLTRRD